MIRKLKKISSCFLLLVFLLPTAIKLEHYHEHPDYLELSKSHYGSYHENCAICNFEFAAFCSDVTVVDLEKDSPSDNYRNHYRPVNYSDQSEFTSLLRGPPYCQI
jgi:hypothetical protein